MSMFMFFSRGRLPWNDEAAESEMKKEEIWKFFAVEIEKKEDEMKLNENYDIPSINKNASFGSMRQQPTASKQTDSDAAQAMDMEKSSILSVDIRY